MSEGNKCFGREQRDRYFQWVVVVGGRGKVLISDRRGRNKASLGSWHLSKILKMMMEQAVLI